MLPPQRLFTTISQSPSYCQPSALLFVLQLVRPCQEHSTLCRRALALSTARAAKIYVPHKQNLGSLRESSVWGSMMAVLNSGCSWDTRKRNLVGPNLISVHGYYWAKRSIRNLGALWLQWMICHDFHKGLGRHWLPTSLATFFQDATIFLQENKSFLACPGDFFPVEIWTRKIITKARGWTKILIPILQYEASR